MMASDANARSTGLAQDISAIFADVTTHMESLVIEGVPIDVLVGLTELDQLQVSIDFGDQFIDLKGGEKTVQVSLKPESKPPLEENESTEDDEFTTESSFGKEFDSKESDEKETIVMMLASDQQSFGKENLSHRALKSLTSYNSENCAISLVVTV